MENPLFDDQYSSYQLPVRSTAILTDITIGVAAAHNMLAAMLLPGLVRLLALCNVKQAPCK